MSKRLILYPHRTIPLENNENYLLVKIEPRGLTVNDMTESEKGVVKSSLVSQMRLYFRLEDERGSRKHHISRKNFQVIFQGMGANLATNLQQRR